MTWITCQLRKLYNINKVKRETEEYPMEIENGIECHIICIGKTNIYVMLIYNNMEIRIPGSFNTYIESLQKNIKLERGSSFRGN